MNYLNAVLMLLVTALPMQAATTEDPVHDALRRLKTTMTKALNERDLDTIVANVDKNVVFTTMNGDVCRGPAQIRAYFDKMLNAPGHVVKDVKVSFEADSLTTLYGGNTGVVYGSSSDHYDLVDGQHFDIHGRWSCTLVRDGDRWLIASFHYSANVFDNPILDRVKGLVWQIGIAAVLIGLAFGVVIGIKVGGALARRKLWPEARP